VRIALALAALLAVPGTALAPLWLLLPLCTACYSLLAAARCSLLLAALSSCQLPVAVRVRVLCVVRWRVGLGGGLGLGLQLQLQATGYWLQG
jgi:hypothetical protein